MEPATIISILMTLAAIAGLLKAYFEHKGRKWEAIRADVAEKVLEGVSEGIQIATQIKDLPRPDRNTGDVIRDVLRTIIKPALSNIEPVREGIKILSEANALFNRFKTKVN